MSQVTPEVTVEVTPAPASDSSPDIVVVETGGDDAGPSDGELDLARAVGELTATVETLAAKVAEIDGRTAMVETTADLALEVAADASQEVEVAEDVAEEVAEEVAEDVAEEVAEDEPPTRKHWAHRSLSELVGRE